MEKEGDVKEKGEEEESIKEGKRSSAKGYRRKRRLGRQTKMWRK